MRDPSGEHLAALAATLALCALLVAGARRGGVGGGGFPRAARHALGAVILAGFVAEQIATPSAASGAARARARRCARSR
jgi:hypothetical protein